MDDEPVCRQCGSSDGSTRGRCKSCGALMDAGAVARADRVRDLLRFDAWDWAGELIGLGLLGLVIADVLSVWALVIAVVLTLRPFMRVAFRVAGRVLLDE